MSKIVMDVSNELPSCSKGEIYDVLRVWRGEGCGEWGPAGIGKTTIARALYKEVSCNFQLKYYKENVEGKYKTIQFDKHYLQNYLENEINLKAPLSSLFIINLSCSQIVINTYKNRGIGAVGQRHFNTFFVWYKRH